MVLDTFPHQLFSFLFFLSANLVLDSSDRMDLRNNQGGL